ncbi:uncharacterized protein LOC134848249 [Symsagittifera roscoffensis]|uniref:uncharacterized protein LOC134848249 n=1 Tax=Symsagittifera roscoffensis TaxID=84072 RepID=UPI00307C5174
MAPGRLNPPSNHLMILIHGPEERVEVYFNHHQAQDTLVSVTSAFMKYFPLWKAKQGPGVMRFKAPNIGLDDEVRLLDVFMELGFELATNSVNNHQTKLVFRRSFQLHQDLPVLYSAITGKGDAAVEH